MRGCVGVVFSCFFGLFLPLDQFQEYSELLLHSDDMLLTHAFPHAY